MYPSTSARGRSCFTSCTWPTARSLNTAGARVRSCTWWRIFGRRWPGLKLRGRRWAFSTRNAGAYYTDFYAHLGHLDQINWAAVEAVDFRDPVVKDGKQAEFLIHESFPWELVEAIGVLDAAIEARVQAGLRGASHRPAVGIKRTWYF